MSKLSLSFRSRKKYFSCFMSVFILFYSDMNFAASCCGGGFSAPALITGDHQSQFTTSYSQSRVDSDVSTSGIWQKRQTDDQSQTFKLDAATIINDRFQMGLSLPIQQRSVTSPEGGRSVGLGDISLLGGFEFLPDWDYSPWRPKGIVYTSILIPSGKSIYDNDNLNGLKTTGRGFWALGLGTFLTKSFRKWDGFINLELHRSLEKDVSNSEFQGKVIPGYGLTYSVGLGYNWGNFRFGHSISWTQEDPVNSSGTLTSVAKEQRVATGSLSLGYLIQEYFSSSLTYSDQAWYGDPSNTALNKMVLLSFQKSWPR